MDLSQAHQATLLHTNHCGAANQATEVHQPIQSPGEEGVSEGEEGEPQGADDAGSNHDLGGQIDPLDVQQAGLLRLVADAVFVPGNVAQTSCRRVQGLGTADSVGHFGGRWDGRFCVNLYSSGRVATIFVGRSQVRISTW